MDSSIPFLREGYTFVSRRCARHGSDAFVARLLGRPTVFMRGAEAAGVFYAQDRFTRRGALPFTVLKLLQDRDSVATLDDEPHRARKAMFLSLMGGDAIERLCNAFEAEWRLALPGWTMSRRIVLHDAMQRVLCRTACVWTGVPLRTDEAGRRTRELAAMIDGAGSVGPRNWHAMLLRMSSERWARGLVDEVRSGRLTPPPHAGLAVIARWTGPDGQMLSRETAAVELINLLRPTVAVANFVVFAALALHHRTAMAGLVRSDPAYRHAFVQEVRRHSPFFPAVAGRARSGFEWRGHRFRPGDAAVLDLYGTDHDPAVWESPDRFRPERFLDRTPTAHGLIPQGGGDHATGHRCPGEWNTIALLDRAAALLTGALVYRVPDQDLSVDLSRIPALPASRFVIEQVRDGVGPVSPEDQPH